MKKRPQIENFVKKETSVNDIQEMFVNNPELYNFIQSLDSYIDELEEINEGLIKYLKAKLISAQKEYTKSGHDAGYILGIKQTIDDTIFFQKTKYLYK